MSDVPFLPAAEEEFLDAVAGYEAARTGLGAEFVAEVERAARRIAFFPRHGSPYLRGTRRIVLRRFPIRVVPAGLEITPTSTHKARLIRPGIIVRVCEAFVHSRSTRPRDYQNITFDASYLLAIIWRYLGRRPGE